MTDVAITRNLQRRSTSFHTDKATHVWLSNHRVITDGQQLPRSHRWPTLYVLSRIGNAYRVITDRQHLPRYLRWATLTALSQTGNTYRVITGRQHLPRYHR